MSEEKRKLGDYEIIQSIYIGDKEVVFGVDKKDPYPFMVCCCDYHNPLSAAWPTEGIASDDYLEAMQIFVDRVQSQIDRTKAELAKFPFDKTVFTNEHCMLNQASTDRIELAKLLNISDLQLSYITNVGAGQGLLKVGSSLVPFVNKFLCNTELYKLMTTKFGEV